MPRWTEKEDDVLRSLVHTSNDGQNEAKLTFFEIAAAMQDKVAKGELNENRTYTETKVQGRWRGLRKKAKEAKKKVESGA
jgi:hypothetical protein